MCRGKYIVDRDLGARCGLLKTVTGVVESHFNCHFTQARSVQHRVGVFAHAVASYVYTMSRHRRVGKFFTGYMKLVSQNGSAGSGSSLPAISLLVGL